MKLRTSLALALGLSSLSAPAAAAERYALGVFHFNIQYVAGGMVGFSPQPSAELDLDADAVEDLIVTQSFAPVLDLYEKHPSWGVDIELQGYFLDVLARRHPAVLAKLKKLANSGQIDVVSFHYSDQLFIGYPEEDWLRSQALTQATFEKYGIKLSRSVFCQEGQAGEAMAQRMAEAGYRNMIWPKNLWTYQHGDFDAAPLYQFGDVFLIVGAKGVNYQSGSLDLGVTWTYLDDGELMATHDMNPYIPDAFKLHPEAVAKYEAGLVALEAQGYEIITVDEYVDKVKDRVPHAPLPPLFDGTWQPNSTTAVFKWLGGKSLWKGDRDNEVRTLGALAHRELVAAETAAKKAELDARADLDSAWRLLFLSEVTDASGINPFRGEMEYGVSHATEALRIARDVIARAKDALGQKQIAIDPLAGTVSAGAVTELRGTPESALFEIKSDAKEREVKANWELVAPGHHRVEIEISPGAETKLGLVFPGELSDELWTTRALADAALATYHRSEFDFESMHLALPIGLISLGPTRFLIKDMGRVHLAAKITRESGDIEIRDDTLFAGESATWVFHVLDGSPKDALELARRINSGRAVTR
jgi:hypothetical protein